MSTLFVNACMRGEDSRTLQLCRELLKAQGKPVEEVNLATLNLAPFTNDMVNDRTRKLTSGSFDDPMFTLAKQFAKADDIVIGAPYWDLSFPAALKVYIEHICVNGITFHYTEEGRPEGLSHAKRIIYVVTSGGPAFVDFGLDYIKGIAQFLGVPNVECIRATMLDVDGVDPDAELDKARKQIEQLTQ